MAPSLFETKAKVQTVPPPPMHTESPAQLMADEELPEHLREDDNEFDEFSGPARRPPQELFRLIKDLLNRKFQEVEKTFYELDEINSRRISQDLMFKLLKK